MITDTPVGVRILDALVGEGFATARPLTDLSEAALYEIVARAAFEVSSEKWNARPGREFPWEERASRAEVERLAREIPARAAARWWSGGAADRPQVWIGPRAAVPVEQLSPGVGPPKPPTAIWTSSAVTGLPSAWWPRLRDGPDSPPPEGPQSIWRITPGADATVFEIRTPADWQRLCEMFPASHARDFVVPDWGAAAETFDGIHLTVEGLIRGQGVIVDTSHGPAMLEGWDAESTAWLRWAVVAVERLGTIEQTSHRSVGRRARPSEPA